MSKQLGFLKYFKTSALTGEGLEIAAVSLAEVVLKMIHERGLLKRDEDLVVVEGVQISEKKESKCCK